jgi:hypothetical protein
VFVYVINCRAEFVRCGSLMWHDPLGELLDTRQPMWRAYCYIICLDREKNTSLLVGCRLLRSGPWCMR